MRHDTDRMAQAQAENLTNPSKPKVSPSEPIKAFIVIVGELKGFRECEFANKVLFCIVWNG